MVSKVRKKEIPETENVKIKDFLDMIAPGIIKFNTDHFICGNTYRCVWALREYPTATNEQAILRHLGEKDGVTLRIYTRQVTAAEERKIIHNAANKNRMDKSATHDLQQTVTAESNLQDVVTLVSSMHRNREPLLHCAVYIELTAHDPDALKLLQTDVLTELVRSKLNVDRLILRQREGFLSVGPAGRNVFGNQFERVLPASSAANLYPFNYSGKTDAGGFYLGGTNSAATSSQTLISEMMIRQMPIFSSSATAVRERAIFSSSYSVMFWNRANPFYVLIRSMSTLSWRSISAVLSI